MDRLSAQWAANYEEQYRAWLNGQELPLSGTPIRGWGIISPAQQETLIKMRVMTVEDLAGMNDEGLRRLGMGAYDMKHKAVAWLSQLSDKGPLTLEVAALKAENSLLKSNVDTLTAKVDALVSMLPRNYGGDIGSSSVGISVDDLTPDEDEPVVKKPRK